MKLTALQDSKCSSCSDKTPNLTMDEINTNLKILNNWNINDEKKMIYKKYIFKNFSKAINFANLIAALAEEEAHHPDISVGWGYCLVLIHTHVIQGLSINDFILASKIDLLKYE